MMEYLWDASSKNMLLRLLNNCMMALVGDTYMEILLLTRSLGMAIIGPDYLKMLVHMWENATYVKEAVEY